MTRLWPTCGLSRAVIAVAFLAAWALMAAAERGGVSEYQLKAAFLYNFAKFVEWPPGPAPTPHTFVIGVSGPAKLCEILDQIAKDKIVQGRKVIVRRILSSTGPADCNMLFICRAEKRNASNLLAAVASRPVLTVSEIEDFPALGGMINFFMEDDHVRFEVNPQAAAKAGLTISSKLLGLGRIIKMKPSE